MKIVGLKKIKFVTFAKKYITNEIDKSIIKSKIIVTTQ